MCVQLYVYTLKVNKATHITHTHTRWWHLRNGNKETSCKSKDRCQDWRQSNADWREARDEEGQQGNPGLVEGKIDHYQMTKNEEVVIGKLDNLREGVEEGKEEGRGRRVGGRGRGRKGGEGRGEEGRDGEGGEEGWGRRRGGMGKECN